MAALYPTGYLAFVKYLEIAGGILVVIPKTRKPENPKTRNLGLLLRGPIVVNILAFHVFLTGGAGLADPVVILITVLAGYLLWSGRKSFYGLLN